MARQTGPADRQALRSLLGAERERTLRQIAALERLDAGAYGTCERCGRPIPPERLAARPTARTCVGCAAAGRVLR